MLNIFQWSTIICFKSVSILKFTVMALRQVIADNFVDKILSLGNISIVQ